MKIFIDPPNSLILYDLVERFGHEPLSTMETLKERVRDKDIDSPPLNITLEDVKKGMKYAGIEVPSGIRGRLGVFGPLIDQADAAITMSETPYSFGCVGCHRTNLMMRYLIKKRDIPLLEIEYPSDEEEAKDMVRKVKEFLEGLE
ncbi:MAG: methanogenesis marker 5 protein [Methanomassiliicoccales archaeon]